VKEVNVNMRTHICLCVHAQTVAQPHWIAECKMTNLNDEILMCPTNYNLLIQTKTLKKDCDFLIHYFSYERPFWLCAEHHKHSYATGPIEYQLRVTSAVMD